MQVITVCVGSPESIEWNDETQLTGIFKHPIEGEVPVGTLGLKGDHQVDLSVHGGPERAVYTYPSEHYAFWSGRYIGRELAHGTFGENLTTAGLMESEVCVGDRFLIGTAEMVAMQPRMPCFKLAAKLDDPGIGKVLLQHALTGIYFSVVREGTVRAGSMIELVERATSQFSIVDFVHLYTFEKNNADLLARAIAVPELSSMWREYFQERLGRL